MLDRTQQKSIADTNIKANQDLAAAQQTFTAAQSKLDREQQTAITNLTNTLNQANVSKTFAANLALSASNAINTIAGDANLSNAAADKDPVTGLTPKQAAIQNAIDNANHTMQWGSTFYNTTLPKVGTPGSTGSPGAVNPGAGGGAAGGPQFPANIASYTGPQKGQVYNDLKAKGYSDTDIRSAWEAKTGGPSPNADWDNLKAEAAKL